MSVLCILSLLFGSVLSVPLNHQHCPVINDHADETGVPVGSKVINLDAVEGNKIRLQFSYPNANILEKSTLETTTLGMEGSSAERGKTLSSLQQDIYCQWDFRTANDSQYLLLTFDKLSAPFSENCVSAFIAMQKQNAFESRWCGNRKQSNARPMTLFSKGSALVSVYVKYNAPTSPSTGFTVVVEAVNGKMIEGGKNANALRVLKG